MNMRPAKYPWLSAPVFAALAFASTSPCIGDVSNPAEVAQQEAAAPGNLRWPAPVYGTKGKIAEQIDDVIARAHAQMKAQGMPGFGAMLQHTIFIKDGVSPMDVLNRFHASSYKVAPSLKTQSSVGTIIRVPAFADPNCLIMADVQAGMPLGSDSKSDGYKRVPFKAGPKEISETVGDESIVYTAGLEAMDFSSGKLPSDLDGQILAIVNKLDGALKGAGLKMDNMVSHNIYVQKGSDIQQVLKKFHEEVQKRGPGLKTHPSVGTIVLVDGMASPGFKMEMDAVAVRGDVTKLKRIPFEKSLPIAKLVDTGKGVLLSGLTGETYVQHADGTEEMVVSADIMDQVDATVKKIADTLTQAKMSAANIFKAKLYVVTGAGDVSKVRQRFFDKLAELAPATKDKPPVDMLLVVEGLSDSNLKFEATVMANASYNEGDRDVTGKWAVSGKVGENMPLEAECTFQEEKGKITGKCTSKDTGELPLTGEVNGKDISWTYKVKFQEQEFEVTYKGVLESDKDIKGDILVSGQSVGTFTAKKA